MGKTAFLFPGQGAQSVGMGRSLWEKSAAAKQVFKQANDLLGYDLTAACFDGPPEKLNSTVYSQPALFVTSLAALEALRQTRPETVEQCSATAGLSLGEYTALVFAGALTFEDGLRLVQKRGEAMQAAAEMSAGGMVSVLGLERAAVESICDHARRGDEVLRIANLLCPGNIVVSGHAASCEAVPPIAEAAGAMRVIPLQVAGAFHSSLMQPASDRLSTALAAAPFADARIPVVSNVDARPHLARTEFADLLQTQLCQSVLWQDSMEYLIAEGFDTFYEIGHGGVLKGLLKRINRKLACELVADVEDSAS